VTPQLAGVVLDGKYRLTALLGEGGMGFVYAGEHATLGRPLAVKFLRPELAQDPTAMTRLRQEAIASSSIGSPHIVEVLDLGTAPGGMPFIVMEYLRGRTLAALLEAQPVLPVPRIAHILSQALAGLAAAHARGIVHRDLKPENVFLVESAGEDFVKLLDFGISKVRGELSTSNLTQTGAVLGTPRYMAPEQAAGRRDVDHRADLWAAGVILYRALTGRLPFDAENYNALLAAILMQSPPPPRQLRPDLPPPLEAVILTALAREPDRRFASAEQFRQALQPWQAEPSGMRYAAYVPAAGAAPAPTPYTPVAWPSGTPAPPGTPYPPGTVPAPATYGTPYPAGTTVDRTVAPVGAQPTGAVPARSRTGLWVAVGLLLAAGLGSAVAWLIVARPWETPASSSAGPGAPDPRRPSPFARPSGVDDPAGEPATTTPTAVTVIEPEVVEPEEPELDIEAEIDQSMTRMMEQLQARLQGGAGGEVIDPANLTPEQQRERGTYIEVGSAMGCAALAFDELGTASGSTADMMQLQANVMRQTEEVLGRHGLTMIDYGMLSMRWSSDLSANEEIAERVEACRERREQEQEKSGGLRE
jgi:serine/threonine-protein kinase